MKPHAIIVSPLSESQQKHVIEQTYNYIAKATDIFGIKNKAVEISFNLKGRCAGMYRITHGIGRHRRDIRYNAFIFSKFYEDSINTTVPHEVAHYVSDMLYGLKNIKPHGKEWQAVMQAFGVKANVTSNYDLTGVPLKQMSLFTYQCNCREHQLTSIRHNKINKKYFRYFCKSCKQPLKFKHKESASL
ncbi:MAG: SprT-like domain-containing protein [Gammaproteobacteria bacterium]|nr:SprT-like domain-containing protein [Gammaproteobacteria bacterium]